MLKAYKKDVRFGDGSVVSLETGVVGLLTDAGVIAKYGKTTVFCCVVSKKEESSTVDYFPLSVNYIEKQYAGGKIPGGFFKREGKQSDREILISRLIDRPIRPTFPDGYFVETSIVCILLSYEPGMDPDIPALIGSAAAVAVAGLPVTGIVAGCKVGMINNELVLNPNNDQLKTSDLDLVVAGTKSAILMVEAQINKLSEETVLKAISFAHEMFKPAIKDIEDFAKEVGKTPVMQYSPTDRTKLIAKMSKIVEDKLTVAYNIADKKTRTAKVSEAFKLAKEYFSQSDDCCDMDSCCNPKGCCDSPCGSESNDEYLVTQSGISRAPTDIDIKLAFSKIEESIVRDKILNKSARIDGRDLDEIRQLDTRIDLLPIVHGSALFTRGETQSLGIVTLGGSDSEQQADSLSDPTQSERFMLHYNFPAFSVCETTPPRAPSRRDIGHGRLAYRALRPMIPSKEECPYTIRIVSEIMSSNGSTSMATVCSGSLALMAAGVPISEHVAGIAMGLVKEEENYKILTDIMGDEDHLGDMDFKVAGTKDGITALQMDIKIDGITLEIMEHALEKARKARLKILDTMNATISTPRTSFGESAPQMAHINIPQSKISELIGKGGANIKAICEKSGAKIDIADNGKVSIFAIGSESMRIAKEMVSSVTFELEYGATLDVTVKSIMPFGAIVELENGKSGLIHISEISEEHIETIEGILTEGQVVKVKYLGVDDKRRMKFSIRALNDAPTVKPEGRQHSALIPDRIERSERKEERSRGGRDDRRRGGDRSRDDRGDRRDRRDDRGDRNDRQSRGKRDSFNKKGRGRLDTSFNEKPKRKKRFFFF